MAHSRAIMALLINLASDLNFIFFGKGSYCCENENICFSNIVFKAFLLRVLKVLKVSLKVTPLPHNPVF